MTKKVDDKMKRNALHWNEDKSSFIQKEFNRRLKSSKSRAHKAQREFKRTRHIALAE